MGLDMYLTAKQFFWTGNKKTKKSEEKINKLFPEMKDHKLKYVIYETGYWRKANHIHNWFVVNVQGGEDNCGEYFVSRDDLKELRRVCEKALNNRKNAGEILPTAEGFFFGDTKYDGYYFDACKDTIKVIDKALKLPEAWEFSYHSSW